jgi:hypothetical protein
MAGQQRELGLTATRHLRHRSRRPLQVVRDERSRTCAKCRGVLLCSGLGQMAPGRSLTRSGHGPQPFARTASPLHALGRRSHAHSFVSDVAPSFLVAIVCMLLYAYLRDRERLVYYPRIEWGAEATATPPRSLPVPTGRFGWIAAVYMLPSSEFTAAVGLDATVFLRVLVVGEASIRAARAPRCVRRRNTRPERHTCAGFQLFSILSVLLLIMLVPPNSRGSLGRTGFDRISLANVEDQSSLLWTHAVAVYLVTAITIFLLHREYKAVRVSARQGCGGGG